MVDRVICLAVCLGLGFDICQASVGDIVIEKGEPKVWTTNALVFPRATRTRRGLGHLDFHGVGGNWHKVSPEYLEAVLKRLDALRDEMWLTTDAERQTYEALRDSAEIRIVGREKGRMEIEYHSPLDPACYDLPLTLEIPVPDGWSCVKVRPVGAEPVRIDVREGFVRIETRPGTVIVERL